MPDNISRRQLVTGALTAGAAASAAPNVFAQGPQTPQVARLPDVWGQEFLYQWSPPAAVKRDLTPGTSPIRLSNPHIVSAEGTDYDSLFKSMRAGGWTACEAASAEWLSRKVPDSEVRQIKAALKANDVVFYGIHCAGNIIAPDPEAERWQRHIIDAIHSAEELGCQLVLTHTGSMYSNRNIPHPLNWSREGWTRSVNALKRIAKDTAGSKVEIAIEPVNSEAINNPWAQVRLRQDVGDSRIMSGLDITNMVHPGVAFRMTELTNTVFDLLQDQIAYIHAKDFAWNGMMAGLNWAMNGTGNMDYETFLTRISRLKRPTNMLVEFLTTEEEYQQAQRNIRAIADKVGVKIYGSSQQA
ncbi:MAG TPA: sugar phosphate isomerase/epimerase family protein [Bryobacteraceae bacterium]|nr:sugar phosphate isomerase/epimerase family protein [Bryobacteraceae bacterium]